MIRKMLFLALGYFSLVELYAQNEVRKRFSLDIPMGHNVNVQANQNDVTTDECSVKIIKLTAKSIKCCKNCCDECSKSECLKEIDDFGYCPAIICGAGLCYLTGGFETASMVAKTAFVSNLSVSPLFMN